MYKVLQDRVKKRKQNRKKEEEEGLAYGAKNTPVAPATG